MRIRTSLLAAGVMALTGCASITDGTTQAILFKVSPKDARCSAVREGTELGSFTGGSSTLTVGKGARDIVVTCKAAGYLDKQQRLVSSTQTAGVVGGVLLDLGIVDMLTGAMWKYPMDVTIAMDPESAPSAPATTAPPVNPVPAAAQTPVAVK